jgi:hypothetical protein
VLIWLTYFEPDDIVRAVFKLDLHPQGLPPAIYTADIKWWRIDPVGLYNPAKLLRDLVEGSGPLTFALAEMLLSKWSASIAVSNVRGSECVELGMLNVLCGQSRFDSVSHASVIRTSGNVTAEINLLFTLEVSYLI